VQESRKLFVPKPMDFIQTSKAKQVSAGRVHTLVLLEDGTVYATGYNQNGELGLRTFVTHC
jgi:alpha-tubulin suppressor-like RCC1 family protein